MGKLEYTEKQIRIARFAKALSNPARIVILEFLAKQNQCFFGDIDDVLPIAKATVSQHLKALKEAGLIQGEIEAPKVRYCINKENWEIAKKMFCDFLELKNSSTCGGKSCSC
ncbi:MAG: winged helix-turn-helix domain-containing protein [Bacteroidaceae bacterium]